MTQSNQPKQVQEIVVNEVNTTANLQPTPPRWLCRFSRWFRVGFACFLLISYLMALTGCDGQVLALKGSPLQWSDAHKTAPIVLQQAFNELTIVPQSKQPTLPVLASQLTGNQGRMIVFNFAKVPQLCGASGCLFAAYVQRSDAMRTHPNGEADYRLVWQAYLRSALPKKLPVLFEFRSSELGEVEFPALVANQVDRNQIRQQVFRWRGDRYQLEKTILGKYR